MGDDVRRAPLTARRDDLAALEASSGGRVRATEVAGLTQVSLRMDPAVATLLPFELPLTPNTAVADHPRDVLWLGPDEWLVIEAAADATAAPSGTGWFAAGSGTAAHAGARPPIVDELEAALAGVVHGVVDLSAGRAVVDLSGGGRHEVLSSACPLDFHPRSWGAGRCAQTVLGRTQVLLQERQDMTRVFVRPSFGSYLVDLLSDAAAAA